MFFPDIGHLFGSLLELLNRSKENALDVRPPSFHMVQNDDNKARRKQNAALRKERRGIVR